MMRMRRNDHVYIYPDRCLICGEGVQVVYSNEYGHDIRLVRPRPQSKVYCGLKSPSHLRNQNPKRYSEH